MQRTIVCAIVFTALFGTASLPAAAGPKLSFDEESFNWGTVYQGSEVTHDYTFKNTGDEVLELTSVRTSCGCTVAKDWPRTIAPGKKGRITATVGTEKRSGPMQTAIMVQSNDPDRPGIRLAIAGLVAPVARFQPANRISLGRIPPGETGKGHTIVMPLEGHTLEIEDIEYDNRNYKVTHAWAREAGGYRIAVETRNVMPTGSVHTHLKVLALLDGREKVSIGIDAAGAQLGWVEVNPGRLMIRNPEPGKPVTQELRITRRDGGTLKVKGVEGDRRSITGEVTGKNKGTEVVVNITVDVAEDEIKTRTTPATVTIKTDVDEEPAVTVPVIIVSPQAPPGHSGHTH